MPVRILLLVPAALLLGAGSVWWTASTDRWPSDNQKALQPVFSVNKALGRWFLAHAEPPPRPCVPVLQEPISATEMAQIEQTLRHDPKYQNRERLNVGGKRVMPGPLGGSLNLSVGGGGSFGGSGGGGGSCAPTVSSRGG